MFFKVPKGKVSVFKTAVFKVRTSAKSRTVLDKQMQLADMAYFKALSVLEPHIEPLRKLDAKGRKQSLSALKKIASRTVQPLPLSSASKESVAADVIAQLSSTVELLDTGQAARLPSVSDKEIDYYQQGLSSLLAAITEDELTESVSIMSTRPKTGFRPLYFLKSRMSDGAIILEDKKGRLFIYLNTHSSKSRFAKRQTVIEDMIDTKTGEAISFKSKTGLLLPLEYSTWHKDEFVLAGQAQSYKLIKRDDEYFLAVSFRFLVDKIEPETFLGIDRGIEAIAAYSVISPERTLDVVKSDIFSGEALRDYQRKKEALHAKKQQMRGISKLRWRGYSDAIIHKITNSIVSVAVEHKSQVVLEDLSNIANGPHKKRQKYARKTNFSRVLSRAQYQKLQAVLEYKLQAAGLPKPRFVRAAYTSITCRRCGHSDKENRKQQAEFACVKCDHVENADIHASFNIAAKAAWLDNCYDKKKSKMTMHFNEFLAAKNEGVLL